MRPDRCSLFFALALVVAPAALASPSVAAAQASDDERPPGDNDARSHVEDDGLPAVTMPLRILGSVGGGATLRIVNDLTLAQKRFGPSFLDFAGSVVLPSASRWRHGVTLQVSLNLDGEGPPAPADPLADDPGVDGGSQLTLTPSYLAYFRFGEDLVLTGRVGVNFTLTPYFVPGGEISLGATYLFTAGLGAYVEVTTNLAFGMSGVSPTASAEIGLMIDYEVLP